MAYPNLRKLLVTTVRPKKTSLKDCNVVIDGKTFFDDSYKNSGCHSLLGGEYDRYGDYVRNLLKPFNESRVTCFVIFNGCMDANLKRRKEMHQNLIDRINPDNPEKYSANCEPILAKDVVKEILTELGIKYYVTENDHRRVMLSVAAYFDCPIITKSYEYAMLYNSCINPKSLSYDRDSKKITCRILKRNISSKLFAIKHNLKPLVFTLLDEQGVYFKKLTDTQDSGEQLVMDILKSIRQQVRNLEHTLDTLQKFLSDDDWIKFMTAYEANVELCSYKKHYPVVNYFLEPINDDINLNDRYWFEKAIGNGRMAVPYINLSKKGILSGSWVVFDNEQEDAMIPALDIIFYVMRYLDIESDSKIMFIGRQKNKSLAWVINKPWEDHPQETPDLFLNFLYEFLPGFDLKILEQTPKECWILIVTLLYYCQKKMDMNFVHCVLLSYVMLGPVSDKVGVITKSNILRHDDKSKTEEDKPVKAEIKSKHCIAAVKSMTDLFYVKKTEEMNRGLLQTLAEFQHCLQHMNYANKLFGSTMQGTIYHKTLNATFVYNMYMELKGQSCALKHFENRLKGSVFKAFKDVEKVFSTCLASIGLGVEKRMKNLQLDTLFSRK